MTTETRNPANKDLLQSTKYRLVFDRLHGMTFFCQTANLPGVSLTEVLFPTPFMDLYVPGEKIIYDTFNVTFLVDEDLSDWRQIHDWIRGMTFPTDFKEYRGLAKLSTSSAFRAGTSRLPPQYTDATLTVYTNKNNPNLRIKLNDVFPTSLSSVQFAASDSADNVITADATFRFSYYDFERI
jgi:hypothetical protein